MKKFWKKTEGFTLVELVVVIAILGVLAGVGTVGYSGYVKKANMAADQQLLAALNQAYTVACIENGMANTQVTAETITVPADGEVDDTSLEVTISDTVKAAAIEASFGNYFEGGEFKVFNTLIYDKDTGSFISGELSPAYAALLGTFDDDDVKNLSDSTFGQMGAKALLGSADLASGIASGMLNGENVDERMESLIFCEENAQTYARLLGFDEDVDVDSEEFLAAEAALIEKKIAQMRAADPQKYAGVSDDDMETLALNSIMTNCAVFTVATNNTFDADDFAAKLSSGDAKDIIKTNVQNDGDLGMGLSQAALTYALYTAYAEKNNIPMTEDNTLQAVLNAFNDENFKGYAATAQDDINGYQAGLHMADDASNNSREAAVDILLNGYGNDNMVMLLQGTLK